MQTSQEGSSNIDSEGCEIFGVFLFQSLCRAKWSKERNKKEHPSEIVELVTCVSQ